MKAIFKVICLFLVFLSLSAHAQSRFSQKDKDDFIKDIKLEIEENKKESGRAFEIQLAKVELYQKIADLKNLNAITNFEERRILKRFDELVESAKKNKFNQEAAVLKVLEEEIKIIDSKPLQCMNEGNSCNDTGCCQGLVCASVTSRKLEGEKCNFSGNICKSDEECCSGVCELNPKTNRKSCAEVKRCFRPQGLGADCRINPVCGQGECSVFDTLTSGFEIGKMNGASCKNRNECRSNLCEQGVCRENKICKECIKEGKSIERGLKCCEGLYPNSKGRCIPDAPPMVLPEI